MGIRAEIDDLTCYLMDSGRRAVIRTRDGAKLVDILECDNRAWLSARVEARYPGVEYVTDPRPV